MKIKLIGKKSAYREVLAFEQVFGIVLYPGKAQRPIEIGPF